MTDIRIYPAPNQSEHTQERQKDGPAVQNPHWQAAVEEPAGQLNLDVNRLRTHVGRVAEVRVHHSPSPDAGTQRKVIEQLADGVREEMSAALLIRSHGSDFSNSEESLFHRLPADGCRPQESSHHQHAASACNPACGCEAALSQEQHTEERGGTDHHQEDRSDLRQVDDGEAE